MLKSIYKQKTLTDFLCESFYWRWFILIYAKTKQQTKCGLFYDDRKTALLCPAQHSFYGSYCNLLIRQQLLQNIQHTLSGALTMRDMVDFAR